MDVTHDTRSPLDERLDAVLLLRSTSDRQWSLDAGLSEGYLKQQRFQARKRAAYRLPEDGAEKLARAAGVSVSWLRFGRGSMDDAPPPPPPSPPSPAVVRDRAWTAAELALIEAAQKDPRRYPPDVVLATLDAVRTGAARLPADREAAVAAMARLLDAAARLARTGQPVTRDGILWGAATGEGLDEEGAAELAALGAAPPADPVAIPTPRKNGPRNAS